MGPKHTDKTLSEQEWRKCVEQWHHDLNREIRDLKAIAPIVQRNSERVTVLEEVMAMHLKVCAENKQEMVELVKLVRDIKGSMRIANKVRGAILWIVGPITAVISFWHFLSDKFK